MSWQREHYTVGWICAIEIEYTVACELLDEEYTREKAPRIDISQDPNIYTFGSIHDHNVVVACLPRGRYGINSAAVVAERMRRSFPAIRFGLMVGIAGGAPSEKHDIRLGDIVVSSPTPRHGGVIQYDYGKAVQHNEFEETGHLASPPEVLLNALSHLAMQHSRRGHTINRIVETMVEKNPRLMKCALSKELVDKLCMPSYVHEDHGLCDCQCPDVNDSVSGDHLQSKSIPRLPRAKDLGNPVIHYGLIASANQLMKDASVRDSLSSKYEVLCFETEAAGLMNSFPCVVIRGVCDYSDTHKNDSWQPYAAASAAAYAKELLSVVPAKAPESKDTTTKESDLGHEHWESWASGLLAQRRSPSIRTRSNENQRSVVQRRDRQSKTKSSSHRKHKCKMCDEVFVYSSSLRTHMDSHIGEKSFTRDMSDCSSLFSELSTSTQYETAYQNDANSASNKYDSPLQQRFGCGIMSEEPLKLQSEDFSRHAVPDLRAQKSLDLGNLPSSRVLSEDGFPAQTPKLMAAPAWRGPISPISQLNDSNDTRFQPQHYDTSPPSVTRTSTEVIEYNPDGRISKRTFSQTSSHSSRNSGPEFRTHSWSDAGGSHRPTSLDSTISSRIYGQSEVGTPRDSLSQGYTTDRTSLSQSFSQGLKVVFENDTSSYTQNTDHISDVVENGIPDESAFNKDFEMLERIFNDFDFEAPEQKRLKFQHTVGRLRMKVDALLATNRQQQQQAQERQQQQQQRRQQQLYIKKPVQEPRKGQYECLFCNEQFESKNEMDRHQMLHLKDRSLSSSYEYFQKHGCFPDW